jgi:RNA-binding protein
MIRGGYPVQVLSSAQRKKLRGLAHGLKPVLHIGKAGVQDTQIAAINLALEAHELIKIKFLGLKDQKKTLLENITRQTDSHLVGLIGHVAILYKENAEPEKRKFHP